MKRIVGFLLLVLCLLAPLPSTAGPAASVACVYSLSGKAFRTDPKLPRPIKLLDFLPVGAAVKVGPGSRLGIVLVNGKRWALGGGARVKVGKTDLTNRRGDVRTLPSLPPLPLVSPVSKDQSPGMVIPAPIIRSEGMTGLYPGRGATAFADAVVLRYRPVEGAASFRVEIQDERGAVVFSEESSGTEVKIPVGLLHPGESYHWTVRTLDRPLGNPRGHADFRTLDQETARRREALRRHAAKEPEILALLGSLDRQLGLWAEAREELRSAVAASPGESELRKALESVAQEIDQDKEVDPRPEPSRQGVVVERIKPGSAADRAGLTPGDLLVGWERAASPPANPELAEGRLTSPFVLIEVEVEQAPRGQVRLAGLRGSTAHTWEIPPGEWGVETRPQLRSVELDEYEIGRRWIAEGKVPEGLLAWRKAASRLAAEGEVERAAWWFQQIAGAQIESGDRTAARATYEELLATLGSRLPAGIAASLKFQSALNLRRAGDLASSAEQSRQAIEALRIASPESLTEAQMRETLGRIYAMQGDLESAKEQLSRALSLCERLAPGSLTVATPLGDLGIVERHLKNFTTAEDLQRRALEIDQRLDPDSLGVANDLTNLAGLESARRDFPAAVEHYKQALSLREKLAPESSSVAAAMDNLAAALLDLDEPAAGAAYEKFESSLALRRRLRESDPEIVTTLLGLGTAAWARHDNVLAERWLRQALPIYEKESPGSIEHAIALNNLGDVLLDQGRLAEAESLCRNALTIFQRLAPGTEQEATAYRDLAVIVRRSGRLDEAQELYEKALRSLDRAGWQLAGTGQGRSSFISSFASFYREAVDLLVVLGRQKEAFAILERFRARDLLALLAERKLNFATDVPPDLESERLLANAEYESVLAKFAALSSDRPSARKTLQTQLDEARLHQEVVRARIRATSPRLAALRDPEPLDLAETAKVLDPGTLLLSYSIGKDRSYVFAVGPGREHFAVFPIAAGQKTLREEVRRLRALLEERKGEARSFLRATRRLTSLLLAPAAREIAAADRLLIVPDGPLNLFPFAALSDPSRPRYLVESKPVHTSASATLFAGLKGHRHRNRAQRLLAFGDPIYSASPSTQDPVLRGALREGLRLDPLPASRSEVQSLGRLFPKGAQVYLGADATEERAKTAGPDRTLVHFACHALVNERFPLESALVLTLPTLPGEGKDNGLLQAWEIFEQVHLDADLVTLSACDSAIGKELAGEGLLGLTRAFQYAGARSVVASLWSIDDASTSELMRRFYSHLREGKAKDEALRLAQLELIRSPLLSHPYHWAAFELFGDWK